MSNHYAPDDSANFGAAGGVYVSPSGELIFYSAEYDNDGPDETVRFGEWRHREVVRPGSPTLRPTTLVGGPFAVDEGGTTSLSAQAAGPQTKAWLMLFEDDGVGLSLPGSSDKDDWLMVDYEDWLADDFDDFKEEHYSDDAGSWRWFAPVGCTLRANDDDFGDSDFPGKYTRTLHGTGQVQEEHDLDNVRNDHGDLSMDDEITSMQFFPDCGAYYSAVMNVAWDLDANGSFETLGASPLFSAAGLDGPSEVSVWARGEHPTDPTALGKGAATQARIQVHNVAPVVSIDSITDETGAEIGSQVPVALVGLTVDLAGSFTDAGALDTHTAGIDWDDATVDALGAVSDTVRASHIYAVPGEYEVTLIVTDDDGGVGTASAEIKIVDAAGAITEAVDHLTALAADPNLDVDAVDAIRDAIDKLIGSKGGRGRNGALDELAKGNLNAALEKIKQALSYLEKAEAADPNLDLTNVEGLLTLAAKSVAAEAITQATAAATKPNDFRRIQQANDLVAEGDVLLAASNYVGAVAKYQAAVRKVQGML
jgi:hypothetical protein